MACSFSSLRIFSAGARQAERKVFENILEEPVKVNVDCENGD